MTRTMAALLIVGIVLGVVVSVSTGRRRYLCGHPRSLSCVCDSGCHNCPRSSAIATGRTVAEALQYFYKQEGRIASMDELVARKYLGPVVAKRLDELIVVALDSDDFVIVIHSDDFDLPYDHVVTKSGRVYRMVGISRDDDVKHPG